MYNKESGEVVNNARSGKTPFYNATNEAVKENYIQIKKLIYFNFHDSYYHAEQVNDFTFLISSIILSSS